MSARYKVRLKDTGGDVVAEFDHWRSLTCTNRVSDVGMATFAINLLDSRVSLFSLDSILEVWRSVPDRGLDWYREWQGFYRKPGVDVTPEGDQIFIGEFVSNLDLLERRIVAWYKDTAQAEKADVGETVIKEYVDENAGPGATTGAGRLVGGVTSGLSIEADGGAGGAWAGERAWQKLLNICREIGLATDIRFDIIGTGKVGGIQTFEFRTYENYRGLDRSTVGLVPSTGLNGAGNTPVIFSLDRGSMANLNYRNDRTSEITSVLVLGTGEASSRLFQEVVNAPAEADSPWNHREMSRNANQENTLAALEDIGDADLVKNRAKQNFNFLFQQTENITYGDDFHWGDRITARILSTDIHLEIVSSTISVIGEDQKENVQLEFDVRP